MQKRGNVVILITLIAAALFYVGMASLAFGQQAQVQEQPAQQQLDPQEQYEIALQEFNAAKTALETAQQRFEAAKWRALYWQQRVEALAPEAEAEAETPKKEE